MRAQGVSPFIVPRARRSLGGMLVDIPKNKIYGLLRAAFRLSFSMISVLDHQQWELRNNVLTRQMIKNAHDSRDHKTVSSLQSRA